MTAREMFEKLGYEYTEDNYFIFYQENTNKPVQYKIHFCKLEECVELMPQIDGRLHYFTRLNKKLLKAINKQVEELGWK